MIKATMTIHEIILKNPQAIEVFSSFGLSCGVCELGSVETLEEGARGHGLTQDELATLLKQLNSAKI